MGIPNASEAYSQWMFIYFGAFGSISALLFSLIAWYWVKLQSSSKGPLKIASIWNMFGYAFLFTGAWFACGIGAYPGNLFSINPELHQPDFAVGAAVLSMFVSVPGWFCVLMGQKKMLQHR